MDGEWDYRAIFRQCGSLYMLLDLDKNILDASDDYLVATLTKRESMVGRHLFDVFPDDPNQPEATGVRNLTLSIESVLKNKKTHVMDLQKYDVPKGDGTFEMRYWLPRNIPIFDSSGTLMYILHQAENVTDQISLQEKDRRTTIKLGEAELELLHRAKELEKVNQELVKSRDEALEASRLKSALIANVSHELRTPLSSILGYTELMNTLTLNPTVKQDVNIIQTSAQALLSIVNDLLDISRMETDKLQLTETPMQIRVVVSELIEILKPSAEAKSLVLTSTVAEDVPEVVIGDSRRVRQVLHILVNNGIKFTDHGNVSLSLNMFGRLLRVQVSDTGIGISQDQQKKLFAPFYQVDVSNTRQYGGLGLGLTIAERLVELMGGRIHVQSELDKGSIFWFDIPLKLPRNVTETLTLNETCEKCRILVVEDNFVIQGLLRKQLKTIGIKNVDFAKNGQEGVYKVAENPYDIIFMDIQMPVMDGYEATREIRKSEKSHHVIIGMTASVMQEDQKRVIEAGMDAILGKPFKLTELKDMIEEWYGGTCRPPQTPSLATPKLVAE